MEEQDECSLIQAGYLALQGMGQQSPLVAFSVAAAASSPTGHPGHSPA